MKKIALLMALLMAFLVAGCGQTPVSSTSSAAPASSGNSAASSPASQAETPAGPTTLTLMIYTSVETQAKIEDVLAPFEQANNIDVDVILCPLADYDQKMSTMIAGNTPPDVYWVAEYAVPQFYEDGLLYDLSGLMNDAGWDFADFAEGQQNHYLYDGKLMGVPFSGQPLVLFYNKTMFDQAGLTTPTELYESGAWTVDIMLENAAKFADSSKGTYGIDFTRSGDWANWHVSMTPVLWLYGGDPWSTDFKTVEINSDASLKGMQAYYDLIFTSKAHPMPGTTIDFAAGQLAMLPDLFANVRKWVDLDFEWDVVPMPLNQDGESSGWAGSAGYAVYPEGPNVEASVEMVKFITSKESISKLMHTFVPTRMSVITSDDFRTGNNGEIMRPSDKSFHYCITDTLQTLRVKPPHPNYTQLSQVILANLEMMYANAATPKEAVDAMAAEMVPYMA